MVAAHDDQRAPAGESLRAIGASIARCPSLLRSGRVHLPRVRVGSHLTFSDGTTARVYRETVVDGAAAAPCALIVAFRLRLVRGPLHKLFEVESICNTPLFVGFPGLVSKLWLAHDEQETYRGIYEWDGVDLAQSYARALSWFLAIVSVPGSVRYHVVPDVHRDDLVAGAVDASVRDLADHQWWRPRSPG